MKEFLLFLGTVFTFGFHVSEIGSYSASVALVASPYLPKVSSRLYHSPLLICFNLLPISGLSSSGIKPPSKRLSKKAVSVFNLFNLVVCNANCLVATCCCLRPVSLSISIPFYLIHLD